MQWVAAYDCDRNALDACTDGRHEGGTRVQRYAGTWVPRNVYLPCPDHVVQAKGLGEENHTLA